MFCEMFCFTLLGVYLLRYKDLINATILISEVFTNGEAAKTGFAYSIFRKYSFLSSVSRLYSNFSIIDGWREQ